MDPAVVEGAIGIQGIEGVMDPVVVVVATDSMVLNTASEFVVGLCNAVGEARYLEVM